MNDLQIFEYMGSQKIRTVTKDGDVWFVANDICKVLGLSNPRKAIIEIDDDEKGSVTLSYGTSPKGGNPNVNILSESGVYRLIFRSNKPDGNSQHIYSYILWR